MQGALQPGLLQAATAVAVRMVALLISQFQCVSVRHSKGDRRCAYKPFGHMETFLALLLFVVGCELLQRSVSSLSHGSVTFWVARDTTVLGRVHHCTSNSPGLWA